MTGTALATGSTSESLGGASAEVRTSASGASAAADKSAADKSAADKAAADRADKAAADKAAADRDAADKAASEKAAEAAAARKAEAAPAAKAPSKSTSTGSAAGAVSGKSAASGPATTTSTPDTYVNGNANSNKSERPTGPVPGTPSQPLSNADKNGTGANPGNTCTHSYCSNGTGLPTGNGVGDGKAVGQPCAGCVGKADNKNPKGQAPDGSDHNAGYECDRNQGIGKTNPAHTGCQTTPPTTPPTTPHDECPNMPGNQPKGTDCNPGGGGGGGNNPDDECPNMPGNQPKGTDCNPGGGGGGGNNPDDECPNMPGNQPKGTDCNPKGGGGDDGQITICHATGSATNPYVTITINKNGLNGHDKHEGDIIPAPNGVCPGGSGGGGGTTDACPDMPGNQPVGTKCDKDEVKDDKITICHATGSSTNPYVVITISKNGLNGHDKHEGDIIPAPANGVCPGGSTPVSYCPNGQVMPGGNPANCPTTPPVCPTSPTMGPVQAGCNPVNPPTGGGGGGGTTTPPVVTTPIVGVTPNQPATNPVPMGPPTSNPPAVVPNNSVAPTVVGTVTAPASVKAQRPAALPFTGSDAALLVQLGALLLLAGGAVVVAGRRETSTSAA